MPCSDMINKSSLKGPVQRRSMGDQHCSSNSSPTLLDIFQILDSPDPSTVIDVCMDSEYSDIFSECLNSDLLCGMRTKLYKYQKNSVFKMLKRELNPDLFLDPEFSPLKCRKQDPEYAGSGSTDQEKYTHPLLPFYQFSHGFENSTNDWLYTQRKNIRNKNISPNADNPVTFTPSDVSWYEDVRGGIICEDMGTGKTCECLALVLLTKRQMAQPPHIGDIIPDVGTVASSLKTDLSNEIFELASIHLLDAKTTAPLEPAKSADQVEKWTSLDDTQSFCDSSMNSAIVEIKKSQLPVPRLSFLVAQRVILSCIESLRVMYDEGLLPLEIWNRLSPYPAFYWVQPAIINRLKRADFYDMIRQKSFKVYMSSSTLIVVPDNLIDQWVREKYKHIKDKNGLSILKIDRGTMNIPPPTELINYDIVLISVSRLGREYPSLDMNKSRKTSSKSYQRFSCGRNTCDTPKPKNSSTYRSPLLRVHWKRLIVDEGHIMSRINTTRSLVSMYIISERRWICTGTPTHNLANITSATITDNLTSPQVPISLAGSSQPNSNSDSELFNTSQTTSVAIKRYKMNDREYRDDFLQLGALISKFLKLNPFAHSKSLWTNVIVSSYRKDESWARERLHALMQNIMIRTRPETINCEVQLPPLYERLVSLPPTRYQAMCYNVIVAFFNINAILTERVGKDYFFHPENKKHLGQIVENLFLSCFWFSVSLKQIAEGISNGSSALKLWNMGEKPYSNHDAQLLEDSIAHLIHASSDQSWISSVNMNTVGYWVSESYNSNGKGINRDGSNCIMFLHHSTKGATIKLRTPLGSGSNEHGSLENRKSRGLLPERRGGDNCNGKNNTSICEKMRVSSLATKDNPEKLFADTGPCKKEPHLLSAFQINHIIENVKNNMDLPIGDLPPSSRNISPELFETVSHSRISGTTCNKITYLVEQIRKYSTHEKCIIFTGNYGELVYIDEALNLARISHLLYTNHGMNKSLQQHNITTFSTSCTYNVIVMEVSLAAYGIDLSVASRVWFTTPIWQAARERQAIKRAHRLGQQNPVFVETLVMSESIEEALWKRRQEIADGNNDGEFAKDIEEDGKMRATLLNANFISNIQDIPSELNSSSRMPQSSLLDTDSGKFLETEIRVLDPKIHYPRKLYKRYRMWSQDDTYSSNPMLPFPHLKRIRLRSKNSELNIYSSDKPSNYSHCDTTSDKKSVCFDLP